LREEAGGIDGELEGIEGEFCSAGTILAGAFATTGGATTFFGPAGAATGGAATIKKENNQKKKKKKKKKRNTKKKTNSLLRCLTGGAISGGRGLFLRPARKSVGSSRPEGAGVAEFPLYAFLTF